MDPQVLVLLLAIAAGASSRKLDEANLILLLLASREVPRSSAPVRAAPWELSDMQAYVRELVGLGMPLEPLLLVMAAESGLNPRASSGVAWGLMQAQGPILKSVGWTKPPSSFALLSVQQQLPWIRKMLTKQIAFSTYAPQSSVEIFRMNLSPVAGKNRNAIIYDSTVPGQRQAYAANRQLDLSGKGRIDVSDLANTLANVERTQHYSRHRAMLRGVVSP